MRYQRFVGNDWLLLGKASPYKQFKVQMPLSIQAAKSILKIVVYFYCFYFTICGSAFAVWLFFYLRKKNSYLTGEGSSQHHDLHSLQRIPIGSAEDLDT